MVAAFVLHLLLGWLVLTIVGLTVWIVAVLWSTRRRRDDLAEVDTTPSVTTGRRMT